MADIFSIRSISRKREKEGCQWQTVSIAGGYLILKINVFAIGRGMNVSETRKIGRRRMQGDSVCEICHRTFMAIGANICDKCLSLMKTDAEVKKMRIEQREEGVI